MRKIILLDQYSGPGSTPDPAGSCCGFPGLGGALDIPNGCVLLAGTAQGEESKRGLGGHGFVSQTGEGLGVLSVSGDRSLYPNTCCAYCLTLS